MTSRVAVTTPPLRPIRRRIRRRLVAFVALAVLGGVAWATVATGTAPFEAPTRPGWMGEETMSGTDTATREDLLADGREVDAGRLDQGLVDALQDARRVAAAEAVELPVASGYRSAEEQLDLLESETEVRGSREEALHWVFPPDRSMHVRGLAVDVNDGRGADWLQRHGARYGLCKTLDWEWWHFEWRQRWEDEGRCPSPATTPEDAPAP